MSILRADSIRDRAGTGAPDFPNGLTGNITGTATTATNAQGLTGTPNITVGTVGCGNVTSTGDVTGVNATFSGNLTVQGTTTTIDTAVTAVDSLSVDGAITFANGKANGLSNADGVDLRLRSDTTNDQVFAIYKNGAGDAQRTAFINSDGSSAFSGTAIFKGGLAEKYNSISGNLASNTNHSIFNGNVIAFAVGDTGTSLTINFTDVHATLSQHEFCSFTVILDPGGAGKITTVQIDGQSPAGGLKWSGGSAPSAGASGYDVYTFALQKYGTAANNYIVYGAATNYD